MFAQRQRKLAERYRIFDPADDHGHALCIAYLRDWAREEGHSSHAMGESWVEPDSESSESDWDL